MNKEFGRNVKRLRIEQHINKKSFSQMCGIGRPLLDEIERGESNIRLSYIQRIAEALSVDPSVLFESTEPPVALKKLADQPPLLSDLALQARNRS